jgi:hypothetical protein
MDSSGMFHSQVHHQVDELDNREADEEIPKVRPLTPHLDISIQYMLDREAGLSMPKIAQALLLSVSTPLTLLTNRMRYSHRKYGFVPYAWSKKQRHGSFQQSRELLDVPQSHQTTPLEIHLGRVPVLFLQ